MRRIVLCCSSVALASCSLFWDTGAFTSDESGTDAGADTSAETSSSSSGGVGSNDGGSDSSVRFCATLNPKPKFCADFDGPAGLAEGWEGLNVDPPGVGSVMLDPTGRDRACALMKMDAPQTCSYVRPQISFPTDAKGLRFSFSFRPSSGWDGDAIFAYLKMKGSECGLLLHFDASGAKLHEQYGSPQQDPFYDWFVSPKLDVWSKIEMTLAADSTITITVDGMTAISRKLDEGCTFGSGVFLAPGFHCESNEHEARYDDIVVDYP